MNKKNLEKKTTWRNWLIRKLLSNENSKEDILSFIKNDNETNQDRDNFSIDENNEENLIKNILNLNEKSVEDIMVPRAEIISIEKNKSINEILAVIDDESHSRMPVYDQNLDNSLGFFHIKDLIKNISNKDFKLEKIMRDVLYVAPKSPILDLLKRMRSSRIHMGLVVDEFGGVDGLITIEDLVEEIVGEIEDEHDAENNEFKIRKIDNKTIVVDSSYKIIDLEIFFNIQISNIEDEEIDTVGGLVFYIANKVPKNDEEYIFDNQLKFRVLKADARRINLLKIIKIS